MKSIQAAQFIDREGRRVLTDAGKPGREGKEGCGSTTEQMQGEIAASIYAYGPRMNNAQLEEIISWVKLYKTN